MATIKNFTKQALAFMSGDTDGVIAQQNFRKCSSALESQVAVLKGKRVDLEEAVGDKTEALQKAKFPADKVTDGQSFIRTVVQAKAAVEAAQADLDECNDTISYYEAILAEYNEDVEAAEQA